jgi:hypothetical protein
MGILPAGHLHSVHLSNVQFEQFVGGSPGVVSLTGGQVFGGPYTLHGVPGLDLHGHL